MYYSLRDIFGYSVVVCKMYYWFVSGMEVLFVYERCIIVCQRYYQFVRYTCWLVQVCEVLFVYVRYMWVCEIIVW